MVADTIDVVGIVIQRPVRVMFEVVVISGLGPLFRGRNIVRHSILSSCAENNHTRFATLGLRSGGQPPWSYRPAGGYSRRISAPFNPSRNDGLSTTPGAGQKAFGNPACSSTPF